MPVYFLMLQCQCIFAKELSGALKLISLEPLQQIAHTLKIQ
jgi:hypothetical protein